MCRPYKAEFKKEEERTKEGFEDPYHPSGLVVDFSFCAHPVHLDEMCDKRYVGGIAGVGGVHGVMIMTW